MKKIALFVMATFLSLTLIPMQLNAANGDDPAIIADVSTSIVETPLDPADAARIMTLELRLVDIKDMDLENLESSDKKELRNEVRSIKHELKTIGGGVYISAGGLILVLILLIILL